VRRAVRARVMAAVGHKPLVVVCPVEAGEP
jgi:hypothetical protein